LDIDRSPSSSGRGGSCVKADPAAIDFKRPDMYKYHCAFHASMTGVVVVKS
jgi:plastocyanin